MRRSILKRRAQGWRRRRSEEGRVGEEGRFRGGADHLKKKKKEELVCRELFKNNNYREEECSTGESRSFNYCIHAFRKLCICRYIGSGDDLAPIHLEYVDTQ